MYACGFSANKRRTIHAYSTAFLCSAEKSGISRQIRQTLGIEARDNPLRLLEAISPEERHDAKKNSEDQHIRTKLVSLVYLDEIHRIQVRSFSKLLRGAK
jgi:hypothetical protein